MLFSEWARQQHHGGGSFVGAGDATPAAVLFAELIESLEVSLKLTEEARHLQQVAEFRQRWESRSESNRAKALDGKIREIEARLASSVEAALTPLLEEAVLKKGIEDFCGVLQRHLQTASADERLVIKAPGAWLPLLGEKLDVNGIAAEIEEHACGEVSTSIDGTEIETDIGAWIGRLRKVAA